MEWEKKKKKQTQSHREREGPEIFWRATTAAQRSLTAAHSLVHLCMFYFVFWATTTQSPKSWWDASTTMHAMLNAQQKGHFHKHGGVFRFNCWLCVQVLRSTESSCWNDSTILPPTWWNENVWHTLWPGIGPGCVLQCVPWGSREWVVFLPHLPEK